MKNFTRIVLIYVLLLLLIYLTIASLTLTSTAEDDPTPTEAPGGLFGTIGDLRCPVNLRGIGPTWKTLTVGVSTLDDLLDLYEPYGIVGEIVTPWAPPGRYQGTYAENYSIDIGWRQFKPELGLPSVSACIVDGKLAALMLFPESNPELPQNIVDLIGLLGPPTLQSFHDAGDTYRMVHWPMDGISAQIEFGGSAADVVFYYPFQRADYALHWPMNNLLTVAPTPFSSLHPILELDTIDDAWVAENLTAYPRATKTPHFTPTPKP